MCRGMKIDTYIRLVDLFCVCGDDGGRCRHARHVQVARDLGYASPLTNTQRPLEPRHVTSWSLTIAESPSDTRAFATSYSVQDPQHNHPHVSGFALLGSLIEDDNAIVNAIIA